MVIAPLCWLLFGMGEFGAMSLAQTALDNAVAETGRKVRTGEAQAGGATAASMKQSVCDELNNIMKLDCGDLYIDVKRYTSFSGVGDGVPIKDGAFDPSGLGYDPGAADEIVLVRAYYQWKVLTPLFETVLSNIGGGKRLLVSSMMFRNEPF